MLYSKMIQLYMYVHTHTHTHIYIYIYWRGGFPGGSVVKHLPANAGDWSFIPGLGKSLEKKMTTYPSILAWDIPWTEEPGATVHCIAQSQT